MKACKRRIFGPRIVTEDCGPLVRLGSDHGGWTLVKSKNLQQSTLLSCGLGEDASFDVEFSSHFQANVIIVDPTPRAVTHFSALLNRCGQPAKHNYSSDGRQAPDSYDLVGISPDRFQLIAKALSDRCGKALFFAPPNPSDVSHSLIDYQNDYRRQGNSIEVDTIDYSTLMSLLDPASLSVVKLDIEGSEGGVIPQIIQQPRLPDQILIEYDELNRPSAYSRDVFERGHCELLQANYIPTYFDGRTCVSYFNKDAITQED